MARKRATVRCNQHDFASPTSHAGLRVLSVVIRHDVLDADFAAQTFLCGFYFCHKFVELPAAWQQKIAICKTPAIVLDVRKFDAGRGGRLGDGQHRIHLVKIVAMQDEIQGDADSPGFEPLEDAKLLSVRFCSRDVFGDAFRSSLKTQLKMVETGSDEGIEPRFVERQAGSDEADVESC